MTCVLQVTKHSLGSLATATLEFGRILGSEEATSIVFGRKKMFCSWWLRADSLGPRAGRELSGTTSKLRHMNGLVHVIFPATLSQISLYLWKKKKSEIENILEVWVRDYSHMYTDIVSLFRLSNISQCDFIIIIISV